MLVRILRASAFDPSLYEEVEHDSGATGQAALIVVLAAVSAGLGGLRGGLGSLASNIVWGIVGWLLFSLIVYVIGTTFFRRLQTQATWGQVMRTVGFANSPSLLSFITVVPLLGWPFSVLIPVWVLGTSTIGVRAALDFPLGNAFLTVVIGWVIWFIVRLILFAIF